MAIKKVLLAGGIAATLAGAGLIGALVANTSVSYAEEATDEDSGGPPGPRGAGPGRSRWPSLTGRCGGCSRDH